MDRDLHLYDVLGVYLTPGDILGHEPMGIVEEVGPQLTISSPGTGWSCRSTSPVGTARCARGVSSHSARQRRVTQQGKGACLFGYTALCASVPGAGRAAAGAAGSVQSDRSHARASDERCLFLSDVLTTFWQAVKYADIEAGSTCAVIGLDPIGRMCARIAEYLGAEQVIALDTPT